MRKKIFIKAVSALSVFGIVACTSAFGAGAVAIDRETAVSADNGAENFLSDEALPAKYSSVELGFVTDIKSQQYNDCWAVSSISVFESKLLHDGFSVNNISQDHLNLWATKRSNGTGWQRTYRDSGYADTAIGYFTSWQGGVESEALGDFDITGEISPDSLDPSLVKYGVTAVEYLYKSDPDSIKRSIIENGGVYTAYGTTASCVNSDRTAYFMPESYSGDMTGHAVEIVGWDNNYARSNFDGTVGSKPKKPGAWLARNSYGNYNSLGGYFWISYEDKYVFDQKYAPLYSIKSVQETNENTRLEQNEIYGATYEIEIEERNEVSFINRFDFSNGYNTLDKVIFETKCKNADYTLYYVPDNSRNMPTSDRDRWIKLYEGTADYKGYICAETDDFTLPLGYGSIAVVINTEQLNKDVEPSSADFTSPSLGTCEWLTNKNSGEYILINDSHYGDSFIYYDNQMRDLLDWYKTENNDDLGGTLVIKAVTTGNGAEITTLGDVNLDGIVNIVDVTYIQKHLAEDTKLSEVRKLNADVNCDGKVTIADATEIQKMISNAQ